ncbi:flavin reductase family protein [Streptomyces sp. SP18CS02]|uniref:flavin reductase family protein n=1 Tax=Streptomyces sp. SP18CS02 TaxID=3002531 RepID=UPI002E78CA6B|nr:flavin reductase family protein [Streptomyces sp. SP18CS02]MEE1757279.1 flavin reductase family protein [Streptomyces sp. SP18CS02]
MRSRSTVRSTGTLVWYDQPAAGPFSAAPEFREARPLSSRGSAVGHELGKVIRSFATGVCVAATYTDTPDGRRHDAITVNSLTSVSLEPPLICICLPGNSDFLSALRSSNLWAVSILHTGGDEVARILESDRQSRMAALPSLTAAPGPSTGALVLDCLGWLECVLRDEFDAGDHTVVIGEVLATGAQERRSPLISLHGRYHATGAPRTAAPPVPTGDIR